VFVGSGSGQHADVVGAHAAGDEHLRAAQHVVVAVAHRAGLDARHVAARARLGDGERRNLFAGEHGRNDALLLFLVAQDEDGRKGDAQGPEPRDDAARSPGEQPLDAQEPVQHVAAAAAELLWVCRAEDTRRCRLSIQLPRELSRLFPLGHAGSDLLFCKADAGLSVQLVRFVELHGGG